MRFVLLEFARGNLLFKHLILLHERPILCLRKFEPEHNQADYTCRKEYEACLSKKSTSAWDWVEHVWSGDIPYA